jgi:hypothetical protein
MKFPQPTLSELYHKQPYHRLEKVGLKSYVLNSLSLFLSPYTRWHNIQQLNSLQRNFYLSPSNNAMFISSLIPLPMLIITNPCIHPHINPTPQCLRSQIMVVSISQSYNFQGKLVVSSRNLFPLHFELIKFYPV